MQYRVVNHHDARPVQRACVNVGVQAIVAEMINVNIGPGGIPLNRRVNRPAVRRKPSEQSFQR